MGNLGKQKVRARQIGNIGQRKSIFQKSKFPPVAQNVRATSATTDLSEYRQPQTGEMIANVMGNLVNSNYSSPPSYMKGKPLQVPRPQPRDADIAPVHQLKAPLQSSLLTAHSTPNKTGLPDSLKAGVENLSGYSLDNVKVHYNSPKPAQLKALAYTQGNNIHVGPGQEKHLPHEAWHVVQQKQGRVKPTLQFQGVGINDNAVLEREADQMGKTALQYPNQNYGVQLNQETSNLSTQRNYNKVAQLQIGTEKKEEIRSRVFPWATTSPDCLRVSTQLWHNFKSNPIEGQTEVRLAKYVWWRGKGNDKGGRMMTTDGKQEILTAQSHVALRATIDGSTYIIDVTIGQFMKPKEVQIFMGTVDEWEQKLMALTDGRKDTIERKAHILEGYESFARPDKLLDEEHYVDEITAYKRNLVPGQKKYGEKQKSKSGGLKSKLSSFFKKTGKSG